MSFGLEVFKSSGALKVSAQSRGFNVRFATSVHLENVEGKISKQVSLPSDFDDSLDTVHVFFVLGFKRSGEPSIGDVPLYYVPYSYSVDTTAKTVTVSLDLPAKEFSTYLCDFAILVTN